MEEGYVKFHAEWEKSPPMPLNFFKDLNKWRDRMYNLGLVGVYPEGIGYGNISQRFDKKGSFLITGSATGQLQKLTASHYSMVSKVRIEKNWLRCQGPVIASSESMSHAVIYRECPAVQGVIHVHHYRLWDHLLHQVPTTPKSAAYGTPEVALEIIRLLRDTDLSKIKIFVMEGHKEGIFTFGNTLDEAGEILLHYYHQLPASPT